MQKLIQHVATSYLNKKAGPYHTVEHICLAKGLNAIKNTWTQWNSFGFHGCPHHISL
jgi:hypothetical protein